jgi:hypothetical protein
MKILLSGNDEKSAWIEVDTLAELEESYSLLDIIGIDLSEHREEVTDKVSEVLNKMINLTQLIISETKITNIDFVENMPNLQHLEISGLNIANINILRTLTNLEIFIANDVPIKDLSPFTGTKKLKTFACERGKFSDLTPLAESHNLEYIDLNGCKGVKDISMLAQLFSLRGLNIQNTSIHFYEQIAGLEQLKKLETLVVNSDLEYVIDSFTAKRKTPPPFSSELFPKQCTNGVPSSSAHTKGNKK